MAGTAGPYGTVDDLASRLAPYLRDESLLLNALTHRSHCAEASGAVSNERLEHLGDAVLGLVVSEHLYLSLPGVPEGDLARIRAAVVSTAALAPVAARAGVGAALLLGRGEDLSGGREKQSILADAFEAIVGATFLDAGLDAARALVLDLLGEQIADASAVAELGDAKNRLQELASRLGRELPRYEVSESGPDHAKCFAAVVVVGDAVAGRGAGHSKKQAERAAALEALEALEARGPAGACVPAGGAAGGACRHGGRAGVPRGA